MKHSISILAAIAALPAALAAPLTNSKRQLGSVIRGVNIGGWLLMEPWITPSIFDATGNDAIVDEWTFGQYQDHATAEAAINNHLYSFYSIGDFHAIKAAGLTHVRIPFPYWGLDTSDGTPYIGADRYSRLKDAVGWARDVGLKVWVDLHGVPGSQNGFDNSGRRGDATWFQQQSNIERSYNYINILANEFSNPVYGGAVESIELVNEPAGFLNSQNDPVTRDYYQNGYNVIGGRFGVVIADLFEPVSSFNGFMTAPQYENVYLDAHRYQVFSSPELARSDQEHFQTACSEAGDLAWHSNNQHWVVVGEFTLAKTDCARYLNGRGIGARWDGSYSGSYYIDSCNAWTGNGDNFSDSYKDFLRQYFEAQTSTWEQGRGWFYWTWKNEEAADWSYSRGLQLGFIPQNPSERQYPNICG